MSPRGARWLLFATLVAVLPLPFYAAVATGSAPVLRLAVLAGACLALIATEGAVGMVGVFTALFSVQALAWGTALWWASRWLAAGLGRLAPARLAAATLLTAALAVALAATTSPYRTPFHGESLYPPLWRILR